MPRRPGKKKKHIEIYPRLIKLPPLATLPPYVRPDFPFYLPSTGSGRCGRCNFMVKRNTLTHTHTHTRPQSPPPLQTCARTRGLAGGSSSHPARGWAGVPPGDRGRGLSPLGTGRRATIPPTVPAVAWSRGAGRTAR